MDLRARLRNIEKRKRRDAQLLDDIRAGKYEHIAPASEYFAQKAEAPSPPPATPHPKAPPENPAGHALIMDQLRDARLVVGKSGRTIVREVTIDGEAALLASGYREGLLGGSGPVPMGALHHICKELEPADFAGISPGEIGFIDTETTGLAGGAGTVAFLVGCGWWEPVADGWRFRLEQYLIEDFCHERDMMERLAERLASFKVLVSFNGKCFDVPLLRSRAIMNRISPSVLNKFQVDLLHPARRLWKDVLPNVQLSTVEREVLGVYREGDIDSGLIPELFLNFARTGVCEEMTAILDHNVQDIASMAPLLVHLALAYDAPESCPLVSRWEEYRALSRWLEQQRDFDGAVRLIERAIEGCQCESDERAMMHKLAMLHKRRRDWAPAVELWDSLARGPLRRSATAWTELAKYHERAAKDPQAALAIVRKCLSQATMESELAMFTNGKDASVVVDFVADLEKRRARLEKRIAQSKKPRVEP